MASAEVRGMVLEALTAACSQDMAVMKPAEKQLQTWEIQPGFHSTLAAVFTDHSISASVRLQAVLYLKNGVDRYWRKSAPNALSEEEKENIKKQLVSMACFKEPHLAVAKQLAVLAGKVARTDCPRQWEALLPTLLNVMRYDDLLIQERSLLITHHVTKTLASKCLASDRRLFEELTSEVFGYIHGLWKSYLDTFLRLAAVHDENMLTAIDRCTLVMKIMRKQIVFGMKDLNANPEAVEFFSNAFSHLETLLDCRRSMWGNHQMVEACERLIVNLTKILLDTLQSHPECFLPYIRTTLEFVVRFNFTQKGVLFERFVVNCFNLMKGILFSGVYKLPKHSSEPTTPVAIEASKIISEFFTMETLSEICRRLVSQYFLLTSDDLQEWDSDPEDFCQEEGGDSYKYSLRPCTEVLFLTIFKEFRQSLVPVLLQMMQDHQGPCQAEDMAAILQKDAVYYAVGLASYDLFDDIDFDQWFKDFLISELQVKHVNYRIIRKRVIWLVGQWVGVKMSDSLRPALYEAVLTLLVQTEDLAVRLEAAMTLKTAVDDFAFKTDQLLPYMDHIFSLLFQLLKEVRECDTKMQVLHVFSFVIERLGHQIRPYTSALVQYLPMLWQESADHNMLRCAILSTLIRIVEGFGSSCMGLYDILVPAVRMSTDTSDPQHIYLLEEGLELWLTTLLNSPHMTPQLLTLFNNMPALFELGTENLKTCLKITEAYILLEPQQFMMTYSEVLSKYLTDLVTDLRAEGVILITSVVELVFKAFPQEGPKVFRSLLSQILNDLLKGEEDNNRVTTVYLSLLARMMLQNQPDLWWLLEHVAQARGQQSQAVLSKLLDCWVDKVDVIADTERRKLSALALAAFLSINLGPVLERFALIINTCVQVLHDVLGEDETGKLADLLLIGDVDEIPHSTDDEEETEQEKRKRMLSRQDPVHVVSLKDFVLQQLGACQQLHGASVYNQLMASVDPDVTQQLQSLIH